MDNTVKNEYTKDDIDYIFKDELRNHYLKRNNVVNNEEYYYLAKKEDSIDIKKDNSFFTKLKYKFMLKVAGTLLIGVGIAWYKYFPENVKTSSVLTYIKTEYRKNYTKDEVIEKSEDLAKKIYGKFEKYIPSDVYNRVVSTYIEKVKPKIVIFSLPTLVKGYDIDNTVAVFNESNIDTSNDISNVEKDESVSSQMSLMDMDASEILAKNINIIIPVEGTITSTYGAREEVFKNVGYHTGIDIANSLNTPVKSATDGKVVFVKEMDKYYGNNIEIEINGVTFRYAHLNKINVNLGDSVKQGDIIGLMGSTGASTGSHLHFEIIINSRIVDPEMILKFR